MAWLAVHPSNTIKERVPDVDGAPVFEFGFWPPLEAEFFGTFMKRGGGDLLEKADVTGDEFDHLVAVQHDVADRMIAFSVRGWSGFTVDGTEIPCETEWVDVDGVKHRRLSKASLAVLYANKLRDAIAAKAYLFNTLTEAQKKTSGLRLRSAGSTSPTAAPNATPDSVAQPEKSSASTETSSPAVPT